MTIVNVQAYRVEFQWQGITMDHTYIGDGPGTPGHPPPYYFMCWGPGFNPSPHPPVVSGNINYNCANCYRGPQIYVPGLGECSDTAGIGYYLVQGVCHQSANCFLFSAGPWWVTLNFSVIGYWASLLAYGTYGTNFAWWLPGIFDICALFNPAIAAEMPQAAAEPSLASKMQDLYAEFQVQPQPPHPHDALIKEAATVVRHHVPGFNPDIYRDLHAEFLDQKDAAIATGITGQALADKLNDLSRQLQLAVSDRVGPEIYRKLNGVDAGQTVYLCDPRLAAAAGRPVPPLKPKRG